MSHLVTIGLVHWNEFSFQLIYYQSLSRAMVNLLINIVTGKRGGVV